jgi:F-type H+-transporting ATPase subunit epsilon
VEQGFHLTVLTPERTVLEAEVYSLVAPGSMGYVGVLRNHAPLIATLAPGKLTVKDLERKAEVYATGAGFMEVGHNKVTILVEALDPVDEIDLSQAIATRDWAQTHLKQGLPAGEKAEIVATLKQARARIQVKRNPGPSV